MLLDPLYATSLPTLEDYVEPSRPKDGQLPQAPLTAAPQVGKRPEFSWPWGLVAIGVMALGWVGIYLLWHGIVLLFSW